MASPEILQETKRRERIPRWRVTFRLDKFNLILIFTLKYASRICAVYPLYFMDCRHVAHSIHLHPMTNAYPFLSPNCAMCLALRLYTLMGLIFCLPFHPLSHEHKQISCQPSHFPQHGLALVPCFQNHFSPSELAP